MLQELALLSPCLVCLFWAITLSIGWKKNLRVQNIWTVTLLLAAVNAFFWTIMGTSELEAYTHFEMFVYFTHPGFYGILYLFYLSLTDNRPFIRTHYLILIPALLHGISNIILTIIIGPGEIEAYLKVLLENNWTPPAGTPPLMHLHYLLGSIVGNIICILLINFLLIIIIVRLINYRNKRKEFFLSPERQSHRQSWAVLSGLLCLLVSMLIFLTGDYIYNIENYIPFSFLFLMQGVVFFYISYHVYYLDKSKP